MEFEELKAQLEQNPEDWDARRSIARIHYQAKEYALATQVISDAPEIPFDEENVLFVSTIFGMVDPEAGHQLLNKFIQASSPSAYELKARLFDLTGDADSAASCRAAISEELVATAPVVDVEPEPLVDEAKSETEDSRKETKVETSEHQPGTLNFDGDGDKAAPLNMELSQPVSLNVEKATQPAHLNVDEEQHTEKALFVGEGEAVHGMDADPATNDRIGAITVAIVVHIVIAFLLWMAKVVMPRPNPPTIMVSAAANTEDASLDNKKLSREIQKSAASVSTSAPIVSSVAFSAFAMPDMPETLTDLTMTSMSDTDVGFTGSMNGFSSVSNLGSIPAGMRSRCSMTERMKRLRESGGEDRAEQAVRNGLKWLTAQQDKNTGAFGKKYKVGMTGLTLLAYLGHCETPESPKFGDAVIKTAMYLMNRALKSEGKMMSDGSGHGAMYEHAIATYALCELFTMTRASGKEIPRLESVLKKSVAVIIEAQDPMGGWSYGFVSGSGGTEDMSVSGWCIQALKAAYNTNRKFFKLEFALDKAVKNYLPKIQDGRGAFRYRPENRDGKPTLTGAALLSMQIWYHMGSPRYNKGLKYLTGIYSNPTPGNNYYAPYYNTQVYFLHGGKEWENYNKKFQPRLLNAQNKDGSWLKKGLSHGGEDSQIMSTALAVLMLEVYYRYLPTTDKVKDIKIQR